MVARRLPTAVARRLPPVQASLRADRRSNLGVHPFRGFALSRGSSRSASSKTHRESAEQAPGDPLLSRNRCSPARTRLSATYSSRGTVTLGLYRGRSDGRLPAVPHVQFSAAGARLAPHGLAGLLGSPAFR